jgi:hypothetical protein
MTILKSTRPEGVHNKRRISYNMDPTYNNPDVVYPAAALGNKEVTKESFVAIDDEITSVPHVCHKRVTKSTSLKRSPYIYIDYNKNNAYNVSRSE